MKKIIYFITLFSLLAVLFIPCSAATYSDEIPYYVNYSGGAFFEVYDENLGTVTCIFPVEFKTDTFAFNGHDVGSADNFVNVTNSTVNGYIITSNGTTYSVSAARYDMLRYRISTGYDYTYLKPRLSSMTRTNISFMTEDRSLYNESQINRNNLEVFLLLVLCFCEFFNLCCSLLRRGRR